MPTSSRRRKAAAAAAFASVVMVATVSPATVSPAAAAPQTACGKPHYYQDGSVYPILCPSGRPNSQVLPVLSKMTPRIMRLSSNATYAQITHAVCGDLNNGGTNPIVLDSYTYQYVRYHWARVNISPRKLLDRVMSSGLCG